MTNDNLGPSENQRMTTGQRIRAESRELGREEGYREGLRQAMEVGLVEGAAKILLRLLRRRFGELPADLKERVAAAGLAAIDRWTDRVFDAESLASVFAD